LHLAGSQIAFGLVGGGWHLEVVGEAQDVGFAVAQHLKQEPGLAFTWTRAVRCGVGQPDEHAGAEPCDQLVADGTVDCVKVLVAGQVGVVDQLAQRLGDLGRPVRVGVDLGGTLKIP
jgi:hypothetical protein